MAELITSRLRELATPQLYQRNAFKLTGLPTNADRRMVRQRRQKVGVLLEVGAGPDPSVEPQDVLSAFDLILGDPRIRLVEELFWLWDTPESACSCTRTLHQDHDAAVLTHSAALERETDGADLTAAGLRELKGLWADAGKEWEKQLRRAAFWEHLRQRVNALDDRQLDESAVDLLREELPAALARPLVQLAVTAESGHGRMPRLSRQVHDWPAPPGLVDDLLERAAAPLYEAVDAGLLEASEKLRVEAAPRVAAGRLQRTVVPKLEQLSALVPPDRHWRTERLRNDVAVAFNNCATHLIERLGPGADKYARPWLESAWNLASNPQTRSTIDQNTAMLDRIVQLSARTPDFRTLQRKLSREFDDRPTGQRLYERAGKRLVTLFLWGLLLLCCWSLAKCGLK